MGPMGNLDSVHLPKSLNSSCKCIILAKELSSIIIELVCSSGVHILLILTLVGSIRFVFISSMYMEVFYVCIDGTSWECWLCSSLVVVWQTFSLCTFTSCLVDILSQALLAKQQQQEEEGADVAFILKLVCRCLTRRLVVVLLCTALQGLSRLLRLKAYILSLFCELLLCSLAQQSAGNVAMVYKFYLYNRYYSQKEDYLVFFIFSFFF